MKKMISLCIVLIGLLLIFQFITINFKNRHETNYPVNGFNVDEVFLKGNYYLKIDKDDYKFIFSRSNAFNKKKNIVKSIDSKLDNGILCVFVNYFDNIGDFECSDTKTIFSYEASQGFNALNDLVTTVKNNKLNSYYFNAPIYPDSSQKIIKYTDYMSDNEKYVLWSYDGFEVISKTNSFMKNILNFDRYDNTLSRIVGRFYVTPLYLDNRTYEVRTFYAFDLTKNSFITIGLPNNLSDLSYVNGVIDNKLYIFDKSNLIQYEIDPYKEKAVVVGNKDTNCKYYDNKWTTRNIYDFVNDKVLFNDISSEDVKNLRYTSIYRDNDNYVYTNPDGVYKVYSVDFDRSVKLFNNANVNNVIFRNNKLYYLYGGTLYKYEELVGLRKVLTYTELEYNKVNMISVY